MQNNEYKYSEIPFTTESRVSHIPCIKSSICKIDLLLGIDCGAGVNLLDTQLWEALQNKLKNMEVSNLKGISNDEGAKKHKGKFKNLKIGNKQFKKISTVFSNIDHLNAKRTEPISGIIGYEILSKQKTIICYKSKKNRFYKIAKGSTLLSTLLILLLSAKNQKSQKYLSQALILRGCSTRK